MAGQYDDAILQAWVDAVRNRGVKNSMNKFVSDGVKTVYDINFAGGYLYKADIVAYKVSPANVKADVVITAVDGNKITLAAPVESGWTLVVYRDTPKSFPLVDFADNSIINEKNLDTNFRQTVFAVAELLDRFDDTVSFTLDAYSAATRAEDAATAASASATAAAASATAAASSSSTVATSATTASAAKDIAVARATAADASAISAAASAGSAVQAANTAAGAAQTAVAAKDTTVASAAQVAADKAALQVTGAITVPALRTQSWVALVTSGSGPTLQLSPSPPIADYTTGLRFRVSFTAACSALNVSGLGGKQLKQYDSTGAKVPASVLAGQRSDVEYDGVDFVLVNPLPAPWSSPTFRNRIINGRMQIDQRNGGALQTFTTGAAGTYCVDRFYAGYSGTSITGQRVALSNGQNRYCFYGASGNAYVTFGQRIEASNSLDLAGETVTLQAKLSSTSVTNVTWQVSRATIAGSFSSQAVIASGLFTISNTEGTYSTQIRIPTSATMGIQIEFRALGGLSVGQTLTIGDVQLEQGSVALPVEILPYGKELALCQRYYQDYSNNFALVDNSASANTNQKILPVVMRATPTVTQTTPSGTGASWGVSTTTVYQAGVHSAVVGTTILKLSAEL